MKICLAHGQVDNHSGSGRYISDLAGRFREDGHEVTLVCHEHATAPGARDDLEIVTIPRHSDSLWRLGHAAALLSNSSHIGKRLRNRRFDVIFGSDLMFLKPLVTKNGEGAKFVYAPLSMIAPIEIESYELGGFRGAVGPWLYKRLQRWALVRCDLLVRFTQSAIRALEQYYALSLAGKALTAVYVSREFDSSPSAAAAISFERPRPAELLWVGRLVKSKNVAFLIRAAAMVQSSDWVLNICSDGPERAALEAQTRALDLTDRVRFLGAVSSLATVYESGSVLLTGSVLEQYSLTIMEAYAFGVPCIGLRPDWRTIFNSNEDQIVDGKTGFVVRDEQEMAASIDRLIGDEDLRQTMARHALEMKQQGFSFEAFYRNLVAAL